MLFVGWSMYVFFLFCFVLFCFVLFCFLCLAAVWSFMSLCLWFIYILWRWILKIQFFKKNYYSSLVNCRTNGPNESIKNEREKQRKTERSQTDTQRHLSKKKLLNFLHRTNDLNSLQNESRLCFCFFVCAYFELSRFEFFNQKVFV